jgi:hypothetical protein
VRSTAALNAIEVQYLEARLSGLERTARGCAFAALAIDCPWSRCAEGRSDEPISHDGLGGKKPVRASPAATIAAATRRRAAREANGLASGLRVEGMRDLHRARRGGTIEGAAGRAEGRGRGWHDGSEGSRLDLWGGYRSTHPVSRLLRGSRGRQGGRRRGRLIERAASRQPACHALRARPHRPAAVRRLHLLARGLPRGRRRASGRSTSSRPRAAVRRVQASVTVGIPAAESPRSRSLATGPVSCRAR